MGGLGNQLFQIFATIAYAIKYQHKFIFPYTDVLTAGISRRTYWEDFLNSLKMFTTNNPDNEYTNEQLESLPTMNFPFHNYQIIPQVENDKNFKMVGYFQSYKYFEDYKNAIFSLIRLDTQLSDVKNEYNYYFIHKDTYTISMHFRLGDYKNVQDCHNLLPCGYYNNALKHIVSNINNQKIKVYFFCESEDNNMVYNIIDELRSNFENIDFVKAYDTIPDWKQMLIMASCDSNIIANSTFSWWGAYFNKNPDKIVTYPSVWFGPCLSHNYMGDMFPDSWKKIDF